MVQVVDRFRQTKAKADAAGSDASALNDLVGCLHSLTSLRASLLNRLASGKLHLFCLFWLSLH